jgi:hypothetical protein
MPEYGHDPKPNQAILNAHEVPPRRAQEDRPELAVRARIVWENDGEEHIDTVAYALSGHLVLVRVEDPRAQVRGYWLDVEDVLRLNR